jgi:ribosome maturation factor RimP
LISLSARWYILSQTNTDNQEAKAFEKWVRVAHFCFVEMGESDQHRQLVTTIEEALAAEFPEVEVVDLDVHGGRSGRLTVYVDRPGGVDIALCEAVTHALDGLRDKYALDVSSPGLDRPLRTPAQFARAAGERVYVKTAVPLEGRSVFRGRLTGSNADVFSLTLDEGPAVEIPFRTIAKAHVIFEFDDNGGHQ